MGLSIGMVEKGMAEKKETRPRKDGRALRVLLFYYVFRENALGAHLIPPAALLAGYGVNLLCEARDLSCGVVSVYNALGDGLVKEARCHAEA